MPQQHRSDHQARGVTPADRQKKLRDFLFSSVTGLGKHTVSRVSASYAHQLLVSTKEVLDTSLEQPDAEPLQVGELSERMQQLKQFHEKKQSLVRGVEESLPRLKQGNSSLEASAIGLGSVLLNQSTLQALDLSQSTALGRVTVKEPSPASRSTPLRRVYQPGLDGVSEDKSVELNELGRTYSTVPEHYTSIAYFERAQDYEDRLLTQFIPGMRLNRRNQARVYHDLDPISLRRRRAGVAALSGSGAEAVDLSDPSQMAALSRRRKQNRRATSVMSSGRRTSSVTPARATSNSLSLSFTSAGSSPDRSRPNTGLLNGSPRRARGERYVAVMESLRLNPPPEIPDRYSKHSERLGEELLNEASQGFYEPERLRCPTPQDFQNARMQQDAKKARAFLRSLKGSAGETSRRNCNVDCDPPEPLAERIAKKAKTLIRRGLHQQPNSLLGAAILPLLEGRALEGTELSRAASMLAHTGGSFKLPRHKELLLDEGDEAPSPFKTSNRVPTIMECTTGVDATPLGSIPFQHSDTFAFDANTPRSNLDGDSEDEHDGSHRRRLVRKSSSIRRSRSPGEHTPQEGQGRRGNSPAQDARSPIVTQIAMNLQAHASFHRTYEIKRKVKEMEEDEANSTHSHSRPVSPNTAHLGDEQRTVFFSPPTGAAPRGQSEKAPNAAQRAEDSVLTCDPFAAANPTPLHALSSVPRANRTDSAHQKKHLHRLQLIGLESSSLQRHMVTQKIRPELRLQGALSGMCRTVQPSRSPDPRAAVLLARKVRLSTPSTAGAKDHRQQKSKPVEQQK